MSDTIKFAFQAAMGDRKGVTALEYGVIAAAIVVACTVAFPILAGKLTTTMGTIGAKL